MKLVYVIVGENFGLQNVSARAVYANREDAERYLASPEQMWFDDRAVIVELPLIKHKEELWGSELIRTFPYPPFADPPRP